MTRSPAPSSSSPIPAEELPQHASSALRPPGASLATMLGGGPRLRFLARLVTILLLAALLYFALRNAPLDEIWLVLASLGPAQIAAILGVDALIYALISLRWWLVVHAENPAVRYLPMVGVRLSVFAVSYFTVGPQIGGEPLQVIYLRRRYRSSYTRAAASVVMDKLLELFANFALLLFGLMAVLRSGLVSAPHGISLVAAFLLILLILWPPLHLVLLYYRKYPVGRFLQSIGSQYGQAHALRFVRAAERLAGQFCQRHPKAMLSAALVSLLAAVGTVSEYALVTSFLHVELQLSQLVTAWTIGWLSFLVPLPAGLGALEASQVFALGYFGISAAAAVGVSLVLRGRDLLIGGVGILLASGAAH